MSLRTPGGKPAFDAQSSVAESSHSQRHHQEPAGRPNPVRRVQFRFNDQGREAELLTCGHVIHRSQRQRSFGFARAARRRCRYCATGASPRFEPA